MSGERQGPRVLVTDYAWPTLDPEKEILGRIGASLIVASTGEEDELVEMAPQADAILTCWKAVSTRTIREAPRCQIISRYGIGLDNIDIPFATEQGVIVANVPAYCLEEVTDQALALLLASARKVVLFDREAKAGRYGMAPGRPIFRIRGRTLGIVGFGKIGRTLGRKARAFGLKVAAFDPYLDDSSVREHDAEPMDLDRLMEVSDYISIHVPLNAETHHLFSREAFRRMRPEAFLINTSRGAVVDTAALVEALDAGEIAGAGLDVLPQEPPEPGDPVVLHPKIIITPHTSFYSQESLLELQTTAAQQVADVLSGRVPDWVVNPDVLRRPNLRASINR